MNLKEYYKEILNNLLMTEVNAAEGPIDIATPLGDKRHKTLIGLKATHDKLDPGQHPFVNREMAVKKHRLGQILKAKNMNPITGKINVIGHEERKEAAISANRSKDMYRRR